MFLKLQLPEPNFVRSPKAAGRTLAEVIFRTHEVDVALPMVTARLDVKKRNDAAAMPDPGFGICGPEFFRCPQQAWPGQD